MQILKLFLTFLKIGAFSFGGGYAMISVIQREVVDNHKWITEEEMLDIIAISQSTPGVLAVNMATFVGYKIGGVLGSALTTIAVIIPSMTMIIVISYFFERYKSLKVVAYAFDGIRAGVIVLILNSTIKLNKHNKRNAFNIIMTASACVIPMALSALKFDATIYMLIAAAIAGYIHLSLTEGKN